MSSPFTFTLSFPIRILQQCTIDQSSQSYFTLNHIEGANLWFLRSLRQLEYYNGILFLTTNRVKAYDDAFLSRIHVALRFHPLSTAARRKIWTAFLAKAARESLSDLTSSDASLSDADAAALTVVSSTELDSLSQKTVNGREIKNAVRTAQSLAMSREEKLGYQHFVEVLNVMEQFGEEFEVVKDVGEY